MSIFSSKYTATVLDNSGNYEDFNGIKTALGEYANQLKTNIQFWSPHGEPCRIGKKDGVLQVVFWSVPEETRSTITSSAYGISLEESQEDAFHPSDTLLTVYDNSGGPVAEFSPDAIYVLFDLPHGGNGPQLIRHIMDDYLLYKKIGFIEFTKKMGGRRSKSKLGNLSRICSIASKIGVETARERLSGIKDIILKHRQRLIGLERNRNDYLRILNSSRQRDPEIDAKQVSGLLEKIEALSSTGEVYISPNEIQVPVGQIDINYEGETYAIGEFEVVIYVNGDHGGVRCINKTLSVERCYHPHVGDDGDPCLGNISDTIGILIGQMKYDIVIQIMIDFLRSVNDDGWMEDVILWPKKGESKEDYEKRMEEEKK